MGKLEGVRYGNFPVGLAARKGLRRATFLRPKRVPKTKKKVASKNPKPKGKLLVRYVGWGSWGVGAVGARGLGPGTSKLEIKVEPTSFFLWRSSPSINISYFFRAAVGSIFIFDLEFGMDSHFFGGVVVVELS